VGFHWLLPLLRPSWRLLRRLARTVTVELPAAASVLPSLRRDPGQVTLAWPDDLPELGRDVALFAHFDACGEVSAAAQGYLRALRAAGRSVLLVSNSGALRPAALETLRRLCDGVLVRRNFGLDFSAWRAGLEHWRLPRADTRSLLLLNDSLAGPFAPLPPLLGRFDFAVADVWAATDSWQRGWHLQSFFLAVGPRAMADPAWATFWRGVRPVHSKEWVIRHCELGFGRRMRAAGLRCQAIWPCEAVLARYHHDATMPEASAAEQVQRGRIEKFLARGWALNPSADLWRQLLRLGFPFIKRELLGRNPALVADVEDWPDEVARLTPTSQSPSAGGRAA